MGITFSLEEIEDAILDGTMGFCISCGCEAYGVEPDARKYRCEECGDLAVYGAEELVLMGLVS
jgi:hypothetical protein